jgi:hypothetical protein
VSGDGLADIVGFGSQGGFVSLATGGGNFADAFLATGAFGADGGWSGQDLYPRQLGDVNGDGLADIVGFGSQGGWVSLATGTGNFAEPVFDFNSFENSNSTGSWTSDDLYPGALADVTGDNKADAGGAWAAVSNDLFSSTSPFLDTSKPSV